MGRKLQGCDSKESWFGVEDPKQRKRIQDRLAQRARRKRLVAARGNRSNVSIGSNTTATHVDGLDTTLMDHEQYDEALGSPAFARAKRHFEIWYDQQTLLSHDLRHLVDPRKPAWKAFDVNGQRMGIRAICIGMVCSWRHPPDLPDTLQPSPLQLTTPHPIWLDRLPFPRLRDNVILLIQMINLEEFYFDLFMKESFHVDQNKEPHDISAYYILPDFRAKWGYLCY